MNWYFKVIQAEVVHCWDFLKVGAKKLMRGASLLILFLGRQKFKNI